MKIVFHTLGCKVNQYETQAMRRLLEAEGFETGEFVPGDEAALSADGLVINSCTVTGESDRKLRQLLRRCRRDNPHAVLALTGCMPQAFPEEAEGFAEADIVLGNASRRALPRHLAAFFQSGRRIVDIGEHDARLEPLEIDDFQGRTRAFVKIQDGCNRFCSYCIIPYARGRVRSKPPEDVAHELRALAARGFREVVLVGINLTAYGQEWGLSIADAVETACSVEGIERVRLGSLEPDALSEEVVRRLAAQPRLCPQFHLALQSGCDATLRRMRRIYDTAGYRAVVEKLRAAFPGASFTTDVIVGFPGETETDFEESAAFVREIGFLKVHVFSFSRRAGTPAYDMPDQIDEAEKARRSHRLQAEADAVRARVIAGMAGRPVEVLLEKPVNNTLFTGYTREYVPVLLKAPGHRQGGIVHAVLGAFDGTRCAAALAE